METTVSVTEFEGLDAACACECRIVEPVRSGFREARSPSCLHIRDSALKRGAEKVSRQ